MPALLQCSNGIIPGLFYSPRGFSLPHMGCRSHGGTPELRDPCPAFAAMSLGISPLLTNEHLIKRKKKNNNTREGKKPN